MVATTPADILILSNGPGEVTTWVRPVVKALRQRLGEDRSQIRISVMLSPCPHATGREAAIARSYPEVDRVQSREHFFPFLLWGKTAGNWDWRQRGAVLFLGGDQVYPLLVGKRLGYRTLVYAEWEARWYRWIDRFGTRRPGLEDKIPAPYRHKLTLVGDLMADVTPTPTAQKAGTGRELVGLLPGSKAGKLLQGVPFCLAIAERVRACRPQTEFALPVAPTLELADLAYFADPQRNPLVAKMGGVSAELVAGEGERPFLKTSGGLRVDLYPQFPAHDLLARCCLALTTVGANTAELAALGIPAIVLLPTQQLDAMRNWDGLPGLLANLPLFGPAFAKALNRQILKQRRLYAWPNIWAQEEIVPELVGELEAEAVAQRVLELLERPDQLARIRHRLLEVRGQPGAAARLAAVVGEQLGFPC